MQPARQLVGDVALVAGERLVSAVAGQGHGDVPSRRFAHEVERQRGVVSERLVECLREPRQRVGHVLLEHDLFVLCRVALGHSAGVAALVVALVAEADRERPHGVGRRLRHEADDDARVDASREQRPQRHVGDQTAPHGCLHALANEREPVTFALRPQLLELGVALDANVPALGHEHVAGRQLLDPGEAGATGDVLEREVGIDRLRIDLPRHAGQRQQRLQLGGEGERTVRELRPQQRLLADAVAREHEPLARPVPQRDREHAREVLGETDAVLLVEMGEDRRVTRAPDLVAALAELFTQL